MLTYFSSWSLANRTARRASHGGVYTRASAPIRSTPIISRAFPNFNSMVDDLFCCAANKILSGLTYRAGHLVSSRHQRKWGHTPFPTPFPSSIQARALLLQPRGTPRTPSRRVRQRQARGCLQRLDPLGCAERSARGRRPPQFAPRLFLHVQIEEPGHRLAQPLCKGTGRQQRVGSRSRWARTLDHGQSMARAVRPARTGFSPT